MVVRLQTAKGKIKKYETVYGVGGGEYGYDKYAAGCGREWKNKPKENEECDHLDCAIYVAEEQKKAGPKGFVLMIATGGMMMIFAGGSLGFEFALMALGFFILLAVGCLILGFSAETRLYELNEYKRKGTINGIRAWRIFDDSQHD